MDNNYKCKSCGIMFHQLPRKDRPYLIENCKECRKKISKERSKENIIKKYGSYESFIKQRQDNIRKKLIEKYGSIEESYRLRREKTKQTNIRKYGVENPSKKKEISKKISIIKRNRTKEQINESVEKQKKTNLERYGVEFVMQNKNIAKKCRQSAIDNIADGNKELYKQILIEKSKKTMMKKYGVSNGYLLPKVREKIIEINKLEEFKENRKKSNLKKYGVENTFQVKEYKEKAKQTRLQKYGDENYNNRPQFRETCLKKYGMTNIPDIHYTYMMNGKKFDSAWEIYYYVWLIDQKLEFEYKPKPGLLYYSDSNREHYYYPDFKINNQYIEIKGDHLYRNGFLTSPSGKKIFYAKTNCLKQNNVIIITSKEITPIINYINEKYGKKYILSFKTIQPKIKSYKKKYSKIDCIYIGKRNFIQKLKDSHYKFDKILTLKQLDYLNTDKPILFNLLSSNNNKINLFLEKNYNKEIYIINSNNIDDYCEDWKKILSKREIYNSRLISENDFLEKFQIKLN